MVAIIRGCRFMTFTYKKQKYEIGILLEPINYAHFEIMCIFRHKNELEMDFVDYIYMDFDTNDKNAYIKAAKERIDWCEQQEKERGK